MRTADIARRVATTADVVVTSARMRVAELLATPATLVLTVIQPAVLLLVVLLTGDHLPPARVNTLVTGVLLTAFSGATVRGTGAVLARDRAQGVLARTVTGTVDARLVVVGKGLGAGLLCVGQIAATIAAVLLVLRPPMSPWHPGLLAAGLVLALLSGAAVGLLIACLFVLTRYAVQVSSILIYGNYVLGGMLIPPEALPAPLGWFSWLVSLHWLQEFLTGAATGRTDLGALGAAAVLTIGYGVAGSLLFTRMVTRARGEATLDLV
ncbi:ABC transporter permease [Amycolatopsis sp. FBCC-B4732]|uniref:ABC transporter permease n=1 Tax=Amycolatopsis sp. FBCC-B4732 TaxID=3079339 RepID=UPI001FF42AC3|nr:ABC transporter permease [Amycolatopsis sp. FBCC-B4732]UOX90702.1 ABC transporter permease [Amycolatopsis sp. FBCC-B4732]